MKVRSAIIAVAVCAVALVPAFAGAGGGPTGTSIVAHPFIGVGPPPAFDGNVSATLLDQFGDPVAGKTIAFASGTTALCSDDTDAAGLATCAPAAPDGLVALVTSQGYVASFAGDETYTASSQEGRLIA